MLQSLLSVPMQGEVNVNERTRDAVCTGEQSDEEDESDEDEGKQSYQIGDLVALANPGDEPWVVLLLGRSRNEKWTVSWMRRVRQNDDSAWKIDEDWNPDSLEQRTFLLAVAHRASEGGSVEVSVDKWARAVMLFNKCKQSGDFSD